MSESKVETSIKSERAGGSHQVIWESGMHTFPIVWDKDDEIIERFQKGDLTAHRWNPEIAKRMRRYQPDVVGLDSIPARFEPARFRKSLTGVDWTWLPGSPKEMNGKDKIYIVGGDLIHQFLGARDQGAFSQELRKIGWGKVEDYAQSAGSEFTATGLLSVIGLIVHAKLESRMGRRSLLKGGLRAVALSALAVTMGRVAPLVHSYSSSPEYSEYLQKIADITKFRVASSVWLGGRTALVIAKTHDAMDTLGLPDTRKASVVMGFPHAYEASPLLSDKNLRAQKIREYALEIERDLFPVIVGQGWADSESKEDRDYIRNVILGIMGLSDIYEVRDPGVSKADKPMEVVRNSVTLIKHYKSPEVVEALKPLGDPLVEVND